MTAVAVRDSDISKFLSLVLRHAPGEAGLTLDAEGWADLARVSSAVAARFGGSEDDVRRVVETSPKRRFAIDGARIRAVQGHSVEVDLGLTAATPPEWLFHGTKEASLAAILAEGLSRRERHHVHLSPDVGTARVVGARGTNEAAILRVAAGRMAGDGFAFFLSENGVWLTDHVPPAYLELAAQAPVR